MKIALIENLTDGQRKIESSGPCLESNNHFNRSLKSFLHH
jgi:hypothetical protein